MKINEYGFRLIIKDNPYGSIDMDNIDLGSHKKITLLNLIRGLGIPNNQQAAIICHGKYICTFWYKTSRKKTLCIAKYYTGNKSFLGNMHYLPVNNDTIIFDIYKCARDNGITDVDIPQV